jgi:ribose transport system permease protein
MKLRIKEFAAEFQPLIGLALVLAALTLGAVFSGGFEGFGNKCLSFWRSFFSMENALNVLRQISTYLCPLSIGMTLVIISGGIDLSVGSVLAITGAVAASVLKDGIALPMFDVALQFTVFGAILAGLFVGLILGWFNGFVITRFSLPPFVATLGMLSIARGLTQLWTKGFPITNLGAQFGFMGTGSLLGIPMPVWISAMLVAAFVVVTRKTRFGRYLYAVGGNERAAQLSGLDLRRIKVSVYAIGGALAGVGGLMLTARLDSATPNAGIGYELDSIAAVVIGGTSLNGGRGSVLGTVLGCLIIGVLNTGLSQLNVSPFWQQVIKGFVILAAVAIDKLSAKRE